jgi:hypothetical protein
MQTLGYELTECTEMCIILRCIILRQSLSSFADASAGGYSASSGHGTMVDLTVFIAIASATALVMPASENG